MNKVFRYFTIFRFNLLDILLLLGVVYTSRYCYWYIPVILIVVRIVVGCYFGVTLYHSIGKWIVELKWDGTGDLSANRQEMHDKLDKLIDEQIAKN